MEHAHQYHHGRGFHYDEVARRKMQNPEEILSGVGLREGMTFVDVGCNDGFFTMPAGKMVGDSGKVYGVDVDAEAIERLQERACDAGLKNIEALVETGEKTIFCQGCADMIFFGTVMHDFQDSLKVLKNAREMLAPGGSVVNLDWKKVPTEMGPPLEIRLTEEDAIMLMENAGLKVTEMKDLSENFYIIVAMLK